MQLLILATHDIRLNFRYRKLSITIQKLIVEKSLNNKKKIRNDKIKLSQLTDDTTRLSNNI
jgi:hypothetical protein